jgi:hypothetical protein
MTKQKEGVAEWLRRENREAWQRKLDALRESWDKTPCDHSRYVTRDGKPWCPTCRCHIDL